MTETVPPVDPITEPAEPRPSHPTDEGYLLDPGPMPTKPPEGETYGRWVLSELTWWIGDPSVDPDAYYEQYGKWVWAPAPPPSPAELAIQYAQALLAEITNLKDDLDPAKIAEPVASVTLPIPGFGEVTLVKSGDLQATRDHLAAVATGLNHVIDVASKLIEATVLGNPVMSADAPDSPA